MRSKVESLVRQQFNRVGERWAARSGNMVLSGEELGWLPDLSNARILDLGCGPATYARRLSRHARLVVGIDLSDSMLTMAQQRCMAVRGALVQGTVARLPFASNSFDACFCAFCFAQFVSPKRMIREMVRVVRPRGIVALMDVVAPGRRQQAQLNRLERARTNCYTRILNLDRLIHTFAELPLRWISCTLATRPVSFKRWVAASGLKRGSEAFRRARRAFLRAVVEQRSGGNRPAPLAARSYRYLVAQIVLQKRSSDPA